MMFDEHYTELATAVDDIAERCSKRDTAAPGQAREAECTRPLYDHTNHNRYGRRSARSPNPGTGPVALSRTTTFSSSAASPDR